MKTILATAIVVLSATAGAYADSSRLDVYPQPEVNRTVDYSATAAISKGDSDARADRAADRASANHRMSFFHSPRITDNYAE
ncbi:hypothetical protein [Oricola nitratireducens]|jgi:hypothetical protein|uniref:hypothetical protein n=1 Tax=Oricola nitratireducens TaxID=2775868 RepID=UPI001867A2E7|nr:hypothetical protein [Oricola nitratireducens]